MKLLDENKAVSFSPTGVLKVKLESGELNDKQIFAELKSLLAGLQLH